MKLNNNGWGYLMMFAFLSILIIAIFVAWYYAYDVYKGIEKLNPDFSSSKNKTQVIDNRRENYYLELEEKLKGSARKYIFTTDYNCNEPICILKYEELRKMGFIDIVFDYDTANECDGYVEITLEKEKAYLKCDNYVTEGFN